LRYGDLPELFKFDLELKGEGVIRIAPGDKYYHRTGKYYLVVIADFGFADLFRDNYYTFTMSWRTENTVPHLNAQRLNPVVIQPYKFSYFRHYVQDTTEDIRISLMSKVGAQDIYVALGGSLAGKRPDNISYDFTTKFMKGGNYMNGKALLLPIALLQNTNSACKDLGYAEEESCILYIGIQCMESIQCLGEIEVDYESRTPKRIYSG
jgi:hypothetical protein